MSYTVYTIAQDEQTADKMYSFLQNSLRSFYALGGLESELFYFCADKNIVYADEDFRRAVGFDGKASCGERYYLFELVYWVTKKVGIDKTHYYYDGQKMDIPESYESQVYLEAMKLHKNPQTWFNQNITFYFETLDNYNETKRLVADEIKRLDELWDNS